MNTICVDWADVPSPSPRLWTARDSVARMLSSVHSSLWREHQKIGEVPMIAPEDGSQRQWWVRENMGTEPEPPRVRAVAYYPYVALNRLT